ncbi:MAG: 4-hydroxy-3-methylbut-2-enyl diphosphate reductase [Coriobacteriales bacterium]|jgi:4-hydroxy-3-methylbut-2-enyl diphosphate reductase|nr:4-hydroxy-3-methylbut-2-enyl diphosphate reductase [Coriobacteriales bacterium]
MEVIRSQYAGACYGVERALSMVKRAARKARRNAASELEGAPSTAPMLAPPTAPAAAPDAAPAAPPTAPAAPATTAPPAAPAPPTAATPPTAPDATALYTLGPLIHNPQVVEELAQRGVQVARSIDEVPAGVVVIRSHGVAPAVIAQARNKGLTVIDATCPHVSKTHKAAQNLREQGYTVVVVGETGHPEVEGILAHAGSDALVVQEPADLPPVLPSRRIGIVVQTTQSQQTLEAITGALRCRGIEPKVMNTICFATKQRQQAAKKLAQKVDVMLVVGGRNSGNTTRLTEICQRVCPKTFHIEKADELDPTWFTSAKKVGITAGASTPENQIITVVEALESLQ